MRHRRDSSLPDLALVNARELATCRGGPGQLGVVEDGALVVDDGKVVWAGTTAGLKRKTIGKFRRIVDAEDGLVTPGFVDPHTHLAFAGTREDELERKASGESYLSILQGGGGIARTIRETRNASAEKIAAESGARLSQLLRNGVTTAEVKTGYGGRLKDELKMLDALRRLGAAGTVEVVPTFLGLHATPKEHGTSEEYVKYAVNEMLPAVAALKSRPAFSDCFCEDGVFSSSQCLRYLKASAKFGFACKAHADEFSDSDGAAMAAKAGCVSADHLGRSSKEGLEKMASRGVTAVLLPGTSLYSGIPFADAQMVAQAGCDIALGTDLSPNSWIESPQLVMGLACTALRMTPAQALLGFTKYAAQALRREDIGTLGVGSAADFVVHGVPSYRFLPYRLGGSYVRRVFKRGREVYSNSGA